MTDKDAASRKENCMVLDDCYVDGTSAERSGDVCSSLNSESVANTNTTTSTSMNASVAVPPSHQDKASMARLPSSDHHRISHSSKGPPSMTDTDHTAQIPRTFLDQPLVTPTAPPQQAHINKHVVAASRRRKSLDSAGVVRHAPLRGHHHRRRLSLSFSSRGSAATSLMNQARPPRSPYSSGRSRARTERAPGAGVPRTPQDCLSAPQQYSCQQRRPRYYPHRPLVVSQEPLQLPKHHSKRRHRNSNALLSSILTEAIALHRATFFDDLVISININSSASRPTRGASVKERRVAAASSSSFLPPFDSKKDQHQ